MPQSEKLYSIFKQHPIICTDTRNIVSNSLFFALKGDNFNGNAFAEKALEAGATYAIVDQEPIKKDERYILVDDVLTTLQKLARHHRNQLQIPFIGITGSNGKTTTKELVHAVLSQHYKTHATKGNLNNHIGVPLTILSIPDNAEMAIIEMGANHQKEIALLSSIADPDYGIISNVGKAHLEGFGGFEGVKKGKKELYDHIHLKNGVIFINGDDANLMEMGAAVEKKILYGTSDFFDISGCIDSTDPFLAISFAVTGNEKKFKLKSHLIGEYNLGNILAAIAVGWYFNVPIDKIIFGIENYIPTNNRSQILQKDHNKIIMDAYNANPSSMQAAILNFSRISDPHKMLILGDMFELGTESLKEHALIVELIQELSLSNTIFIGKDFFKHQIPDYLFFETTEDLKTHFKSNLPKNYTILLKGSRGMKLESLLEVL